MSDFADILAEYTATQQTEWFDDFDEFQTRMFWGDIRAAADNLLTPSPNDQDTQFVSETGARIRQIAGDNGALPRFDSIIALGEPVGLLADRIESLRAAANRQIRDMLNRCVNHDRNFLDAMAAYVVTLPGPDRTDRPRNAARDAYFRALENDAIAAVEGRRLRAASFSGQVIAWLGDR